MKDILIVLFAILNLSSFAQNSVITNEIFKTKEYKYGVKTSNGDTIIQPIYRSINICYNNRAIYSTLSSQSISKPKIKKLEYYIVKDTMNKKAIFDSNGKVFIDFIQAYLILLEENSQTIIVGKRLENDKLKYFLHDFKMKQLDKLDYKEISYINNSNLMVLVFEDGSKEEKYLFNSLTKKKIRTLYASLVNRKRAIWFSCQ